MVEIFKTDVYDRWFHTLKDKKTQAVLDMHIERMRFGNFGNSKPIGQGLSELKINYGAGFRIYYKNEHNKIVILLCGGDKSTQKDDIVKAYKIAKGI